MHVAFPSSGMPHSCWTPDPTPPDPKKRHKKCVRKPAVLGSPQLVCVRGYAQLTGTEPCGCNITNVIQRQSMVFIAITHNPPHFAFEATTISFSRSLTSAEFHNLKCQRNKRAWNNRLRSVQIPAVTINLQSDMTL